MSNAYTSSPQAQVEALPDLVGPRDPTVGFPCATVVETGPGGQILVLRLTGEIDMLTLPGVAASLTAALGQAPRDLVFDLAGVTFCCVRGFALLVATARTASSRGIGYAFSGLTPHHHRVADMMWADGGSTFVRYRSAAAAVTALRLDQVCRDR